MKCTDEQIETACKDAQEREQWRSQLEASERGRAELAAKLDECARLASELDAARQSFAVERQMHIDVAGKLCECQAELAKLRELFARTDPCEEYTLQLRRIADAAGVDAAIDEVDVAVIEAIGKLRAERDTFKDAHKSAAVDCELRAREYVELSEQLDNLRAACTARPDELAAFTDMYLGEATAKQQLVARGYFVRVQDALRDTPADDADAKIDALIRGAEAAKAQAKRVLRLVSGTPPSADEIRAAAAKISVPDFSKKPVRPPEDVLVSRVALLERALRCFLGAWATSPRPRHDAAVEALAMLDGRKEGT